jgi:hypothetical protein
VRKSDRTSKLVKRERDASATETSRQSTRTKCQSAFMLQLMKTATLRTRRTNIFKTKRKTGATFGLENILDIDST